MNDAAAGGEMNHVLSPILAILLMQVVQIGPIDPDYCNKVEQVSPNLELMQVTDIKGRITDQIAAPLKHSRVILRNYISATEQKAFMEVTTDEHGIFHLRRVKPGQYRLLASPNRGFQQPEKQYCSQRTCELEMVLKVNSTDLPESVCPIK